MIKSELTVYQKLIGFSCGGPPQSCGTYIAFAPSAFYNADASSSEHQFLRHAERHLF